MLVFRQEDVADDDAFGFAEVDKNDVEGSDGEEAIFGAEVGGTFEFHDGWGRSGRGHGEGAGRGCGLDIFFGLADFEREAASAVAADVPAVGAAEDGKISGDPLFELLGCGWFRPNDDGGGDGVLGEERGTQKDSEGENCEWAFHEFCFN